MSKRKLFTCIVLGEAVTATAGILQREITIFSADKCDAMDRVREHLGGGNADYYVKQAAKLKDATGGTEYFYGDPYRGGRIRWQSNQETPADWYAPYVEHLDIGRLSEFEKLLRPALAVAKCPTPRQLLQALLAKGAVVVRYHDYDRYVRREDFDLDKAFPGPAQSPAAAEVAA